MLRSSFDIGQPTMDAPWLQEARLMLWLSPNWFAATWLHGPEDTLGRLVAYPMSESSDTGLAAQLQDIFSHEPMLDIPLRSVSVVYQFEEAQLLPQSGITEELQQPLLQLLCGSLYAGVVYSEGHKAQGIQNVYRIPEALSLFLQQKFPQGRHWHFYSILLRQMEQEPAAGVQLLSLFFPEKVVVSVIREGQLLLMQTYPYEVPEDVSWLLLNICQQLDCKPDTVVVHVSGFIDTESATFEDIAKYFPVIALDIADTARWPAIDLGGLPPHYFAPILKASLCV